MGVAIVAIPSEQDPVWKYSSEKIPHMTLIFLGDIQDQGPELAAIESFIQHIVDTSLPRFGMSVDRRGTLGPEDADVLFFKERYSNLIQVARANLLQEPHIRSAYDSVDQFPEWTPHLTMGYPATPAKKDDREYPGFSWVNFDRLALWIGDFDGPTFELKDEYDNYESLDPVPMSHDALSEEYGGVRLEHSGVKGMKWGVHHEKRLQLLKRVANGTASKTEKIHVALTEVSGDSVKQSGSLQKAAHNKATELEERKTRIQKGEGTFKDRVALSGGDRLRETSGRKARKKEDSEKPSPFAKHSLAGVELDADILAHHGVKGMHWGVRKEEESGGSGGGGDTAKTGTGGNGAVSRAKKEIADRTGTEVVVKTTPGKQIVTVGGNKREASADAIRARTAQQVAEKSTLDALSNKDLQDLVTRMNLEQQYNRLAFNEGDSRQSEGQQFVNRTLNQYGDTAVKTLATNPTTAPYAIPVALAIKTYQHSGANKSYKRSQRPGVQQPKKEDMPGMPERPKFEDIAKQVGEYTK